jgi:hypothetical protein
MKKTTFLMGLYFLALPLAASATTLPPELKAYDFGEAYYIEDGGVVISPYNHGFYCKDGIETPEGVRIMPGVAFMQFDAAQMIVDQYVLLRLNREGTRAFFHRRTYRYKIVRDAQGRYHDIIGQLVDTNDFYLSQWRSLEWFDHAFPNIELHPSAETWRTRPKYF